MFDNESNDEKDEEFIERMKKKYATDKFLTQEQIDELVQYYELIK